MQQWEFSNLKSIEQVSTQSKLHEFVIILVRKFLVKSIGGNFGVEMVGGKLLAGIFGGNTIFDILEPPALNNYSIRWLFEAHFCLSFVFVITRMSISDHYFDHHQLFGELLDPPVKQIVYRSALLDLFLSFADGMYISLTFFE